MAGNSFGELFRITTFGESHGGAVGVVLDGCPPGIEITEEEIQIELDRRRPGQSKITTPRKEADRIKILSGYFQVVKLTHESARNSLVNYRDYLHHRGLVFHITSRIVKCKKGHLTCSSKQ